MIEPNYDEAIKFLQAFRPTGFWVLTSIPQDKKGIQTFSFAVTEVDECREWLEEQGAKNNLYFSVNPTTKPVTKKAEREQIASMEYLHVDLDPRPGEEFEAERQRILHLLTDGRPAEVPEPTWIVDSGGGYHAYWKLDEPFEINGEPARYEEAKRWNLQLEMTFDGDSCHNVDRIMRLPGTVNRPDARKVQKGRSSYLAKVQESNGHTYPLAKFTPAPLVQQAEHAGFSGGTGLVTLNPGNIERLNHIDDLGDDVPQQCKIIIVQGDDPDDPQRFPSRSEAVFYVCCQLIRNSIDHEVIYSVLTDDRFGIAESVLEQGRRAEAYALRQIERAAEEAIHPRLRELNEKHAVIGDVDGKCRIISENFDEGMDRTTLTYQTAADFAFRYENIQVPVGEDGDMPLGIWWRKHPQRRQYERVIFYPNHELPGCYNLWRGFAIEPRAGSCELFLKHVKDNICNGVTAYFNYLMGWMARAVQHPDKQGEVAVILRGPKGAGKGRFANTFGKLWGRHYLQVTDSKHLTGSFNAHLRDCVVLFADEAFYAGDKKHESVLKAHVTEDTIMVEGKGVNTMQARNYLHIIMASNEDWVVPASGDERRYFVLDVGSGNKQDHRFFAAMKKQMEGGGYAALLHMLLHYDLSGFNVRDVPKTDALTEQKEHSMDPEVEWWFAKLQSGEMFAGDGWRTQVVKTHLAWDLIQYMKNYNRQYRGGSTKIGMLMKKVLPNASEGKHSVQLSTRMSVMTESGEQRTVDRPRAFVIPTLEQCRAHFDSKFGGPFDWESPTVITAATGDSSDAF